MCLEKSPDITCGWYLIINVYSFPEQQDDKIHLSSFSFQKRKMSRKWQNLPLRDKTTAINKRNEYSQAFNKPVQIPGCFHFRSLHRASHKVTSTAFPQSFEHQASRWAYKASWEKTISIRQKRFVSFIPYHLFPMLLVRTQESAWKAEVERKRAGNHHLLQLIFCCHSIKQGWFRPISLPLL